MRRADRRTRRRGRELPDAEQPADGVQRGGDVPWLRVAVAGLLGLLLALRRVPVVARALTAPGMVNRLKLPHSFWVAGGGLPAHHGLGHLPALIAIAAVPLLWALPITPVSALVRARGHRGRPPPPLTAAAR